MPVRAVRHIRKMRGGAQAHLLAAEDGDFYVVKTVNNPQGKRVLVNEWISSVFLRHLQIATPRHALIEITPEFVEATPQLNIQRGPQLTPVEPGWHFGSQFPGDPTRISVYDFLADDDIRRCQNIWDFAAVLPFDKWMSNADARQSIFFTAMVRAANSPFETRGFVTQMIDNGFVLSGPVWRFTDAPLHGAYPKASVYEHVRGWADLQPWLDRVVHFPTEVFDEALRQIPHRWLDGDADALEALLEKLYARRARTPDLILELKNKKPDLFPNWR